MGCDKNKVLSAEITENCRRDRKEDRAKAETTGPSAPLPPGYGLFIIETAERE
jgi:hypothetical protein